jgi:hypothetical protein
MQKAASQNSANLLEVWAGVNNQLKREKMLSWGRSLNFGVGYE